MAATYRFADLTLDTGRYALERNGTQIDLPRLSYELLLALLKASPNLLTQQEIAEQVWKGRFVSPEAVTQRIKLLRDALGDDAADPRYILGVRGCGYRLIPEVDRLGADRMSRRRALPWIVVAGSIVLATLVLYWVSPRQTDVDEMPSAGPTVTSERASIAILPFENLSPDAADAYFAAGLHSDMLAYLASISSLRVISRTSVLDYQTGPRNLRAIGKELGVSAILEGSVQRHGDAIRVNVRLVDTETDAPLWTETYDRNLTAENLFAIQTDMVVSIADTLRAMLSPNEVQRLSSTPTNSIEAYDFYLSGNDYFGRPDDREFMSLALQQYQRATQADPGFALAWAASSRAHTLIHWYSIDARPERLQLAFDAAQRAFDLVPDLPEAHMALAQYFFQGFRNYDAALRELSLAEQSLGGTSELHMMRAMIFRRLGDWTKTFTALDRALELDPRNVDVLVRQTDSRLAHRDYADAERFIRRALDIEPDNAFAHLWNAWIPIFRDGDVSLAKQLGENPPIALGRWRQYLGWHAALYERDYEAALAYLDDWEIDVFAQQSYYIPKASYYGVTYLLSGQVELARERFSIAKSQLEEALELNPKDARRHLSLGEAYMGLGNREAALQEAHLALELTPAAEDAITGPTIQQEVVKRILAPLGQTDAVIEELDDFLSIPGGSWSIEGLLPDPRFDAIRDDPRLEALVKRYGSAR